MKKRTSILLVVVCLLMGTLTGCGTEGGATETVALERFNFKYIEEEEGLVYSLDTRVVFYMTNTRDGYAGYGYLAPYISENGRYCRYVDGEIVEIVVEDTEN